MDCDMHLYTYHHGVIHHVGHFLKKFFLWAFLVFVVVALCAAVAHGCQRWLGWSPSETVGISMRMAIGAVGMVSWFLPSPLHGRSLRIPRMNSRQLAVLIADDLKQDQFVTEDESVQVTACVQNSIEERLAHPKVTLAK